MEVRLAASVPISFTVHKKIVTCMPMIRYQVKHQKGITTMNTTTHNITELKEEELNNVQGGCLLAAATVTGIIIGGALAAGAKLRKKFTEPK